MNVHLRTGTLTETFFREPNLFALRELALRRVADRVDAAAREFAAPEGGSKPWLARDRFLIAIAPDDQAERLIRVGKRFAAALDAEWLVVCVETPSMLKLGEQARNRRVKSLRLAESLGAQTVTLEGPSASVALIEYARLRQVTRIVVGGPRRLGIRGLLRPSTATKLVRTGGGIDISVIAPRESPQERKAEELGTTGGIQWIRYWGPAVTTFIAGAVIDRFERKYALMMNCGLMLIAGLLFFGSSSPGMLLGAVVLFGIAVGFYLPLMQTYGAEIFPGAVRGRAMSGDLARALREGDENVDCPERERRRPD